MPKVRFGKPCNLQARFDSRMAIWKGPTDESFGDLLMRESFKAVGRKRDGQNKTEAEGGSADVPLVHIPALYPGNPPPAHAHLRGHSSLLHPS